MKRFITALTLATTLPLSALAAGSTHNFGNDDPMYQAETAGLHQAQGVSKNTRKPVATFGIKPKSGEKLPPHDPFGNPALVNQDIFN